MILLYVAFTQTVCASFAASTLNVQ